MLNWAQGILVVGLILFLSACSTFVNDTSSQNGELRIALTSYPGSSFKQVQAVMTVEQSSDLVFRVLSDIKRTPSWFDRLEQMHNLAFYDVNNFLVQALLDSPWPFKDREIISCVGTEFGERQTRIEIRSCNERHRQTQGYLRVERARSTWILTPLADGKTEIQYRAWLEPGGWVPAWFFNTQLRSNAAKTLTALRKELALSKREDYAY